jgi:hypothetical protein
MSATHLIDLAAFLLYIAIVIIGDKSGSENS